MTKTDNNSGLLQAELKRRIDSIQQDKQLRKLNPNRSDCTSFVSNDYLGLNTDPYYKSELLKRLEKIENFGSSGSPLLGGYSETTKALSEKWTQWYGLHQEKHNSLFFSSGYQANVGFFSSLKELGKSETSKPFSQNTELILFSELENHISLIDGIKQSNLEKRIFSLNDLNGFFEELEKLKPHQIPLVILESLYSMSGKQPDFKKLMDHTLSHRIYFYIDKAHSGGILYTNGIGIDPGFLSLIDPNQLILCQPLGKAFNSQGAVLTLPNSLAQWVVNKSKNYIYSTAPSNLLLEQWDFHLDYLSSEKFKITQQAYLQKITHFSNLINSDKVLVSYLEITDNKNSPYLSFKSPIFKFNFKRDQLQKIQDHMSENNFTIQQVRHPTCPIDKEGFRVVLRADHKKTDLKEFVLKFKEAISATLRPKEILRKKTREKTKEKKSKTLIIKQSLNS